MTFLEQLGELWTPKYECKDGALIVGATSQVLPVAFAVATDLLNTKNRLYMIHNLADGWKPFVSPDMPSFEQDKWVHDIFVATSNLSNEIIAWLKLEIIIHSQASMVPN